MKLSIWDEGYTYTSYNGKVNRMLSGFGITLVILSGGFAVLALVILIGNLVSAKSCYNRADIYGVTADYGMMTGCIVTTDEGVITSIDKLITTREG